MGKTYKYNSDDSFKKRKGKKVKPLSNEEIENLSVRDELERKWQYDYENGNLKHDDPEYEED